MSIAFGQMAAARPGRHPRKKTPPALRLAAFFPGSGGDETRTRDLFHAMEALYQN
jgi:hypothetical protein